MSRALAVVLLALGAAAMAWAGGDAAEAGLRLYRDGLLPDGTPVVARTRNGVELRGAEAACANCHRRSGFGTSEGRRVVRPLPPLFDGGWMERSALRAQPVGGARAAPAYDLAALAHALRAGVDAAGRSLDALMPRYELDDGAVAALKSYLERLLPADAPGVSATRMRFATVVTPDAPRAHAEAMLAVLRAYFADRNGGSRGEQRRRESGSDWMYLAYRTWELDVWELAGAPGTWAAQLDALQRERPAFALVSGIGAAEWRPVHEFCERARVPCVLPHVSAPGAGGDFYSLYFTPGPGFEGALLARHLAATAAPDATVVQLYRDAGAGRAEAAALRAALPGRDIVDVVLEREAPLAQEAQRLAARPGGYELVSWLGPDALDQLGDAAPSLEGALRIHVSARLAGFEAEAAPAALRARLRAIHLHELPRERAARLARARAWLRARQVAPGDEAIQVNTLFAATVLGDAVFHVGRVLSRDYLVERIEHMAGRMPNTSAYPVIGLAPGQRHASKGGYVVRLDAAGPALVDASGWIVP